MEKAKLIPMNKRIKKASRSTLTFGDLVIAVSSCSKNNRETALAVADLFQSGRVVLGRERHPARR